MDSFLSRGTVCGAKYQLARIVTECVNSRWEIISLTCIIRSTGLGFNLFSQYSTWTLSRIVAVLGHRKLTLRIAFYLNIVLCC